MSPHSTPPFYNLERGRKRVRQGEARPEWPGRYSRDGPHTLPHSMLAVTTPLLALQQRTVDSIIGGHRRSLSSLLTSTSKLSSAPPVRRRRPPSSLPHRETDGASTRTTPLAEARNVRRVPLGEASLRVSRVEEDGGFNGALYSLKAFGFATALVVACATASIWGVKTYLGVTDTHEFASLMRLTILDKWPLLTSRIRRSSLLPDPDSYAHPHAASPHLASESLHGSGHPRMADEASDGLEAKMDEDEDWNWPAAQARLLAAYERGGIAEFAEVAARELEVELELERRKRRIADSVESPS